MEGGMGFAADDNIDNVQRRAPPALRTGKNTLSAAVGGNGDSFDPLDRSETSPLLDSESSAGSEGGNQDSKPSWDGDYEWAHLPWYKRPSVCDPGPKPR
jgi:hypothetical protein